MIGYSIYLVTSGKLLDRNANHTTKLYRGTTCIRNAKIWSNKKTAQEFAGKMDQRNVEIVEIRAYSPTRGTL